MSACHRNLVLALRRIPAGVGNADRPRPIQITKAIKAPKHAQIRLLRQQHPSTDFASAGHFPCVRTHNATLYATERVKMLPVEPIKVVARATENRHHLLERERVLQPLAQDCEPARIKYKNTF